LTASEVAHIGGPDPGDAAGAGNRVWRVAAGSVDYLSGEVQLGHALALGPGRELHRELGSDELICTGGGERRGCEKHHTTEGGGAGGEHFAGMGKDGEMLVGSNTREHQGPGRSYRCDKLIRCVMYVAKNASPRRDAVPP
jgi:hypothetical protein